MKVRNYRCTIFVSVLSMVLVLNAVKECTKKDRVVVKVAAGSKLAEIAVVFNLAFGEFKSKPFAEEIQNWFEKIDQGHPEGFKFLEKATQIPNEDARLATLHKSELYVIAEILDKMRADQSEKSSSKGMFNFIRWIKTKFLNDTNTGLEVKAEKYSALAGLKDRMRVFSIDPIK